MRDVDNYLGKKAFTAAQSSEVALTDGTGNFDFGEGGSLGYFPDVFIKAHLSASAMAAGDSITVVIKDSADGTTYAAIAEHSIAGAHAAGEEFRFKLPVLHRRYVEVKLKYTSSTPNAVTVEFYLERG